MRYELTIIVESVNTDEYDLMQKVHDAVSALSDCIDVNTSIETLED